MRAFLILIAAAGMAGCLQSSPTPDPVVDDASGGATTIRDASSFAFSTPAPNLDGAAFDLHMQGDAAFEAAFVTAPSKVNPGLGPVFNNTSCVACHARDGRGRPPEPGQPLVSMLFRMSLSGSGGLGGPVPGFGSQLQPRAVFGKAPEAEVRGSVTLSVPSYEVLNSYIPMPAGVIWSPRVAPSVFGLGLLEAVDESTLRGLADENDADGDGVSGRINMVEDALTGRTAVGRFGLKSNTPNLLQQSAAAYNNDMGITSHVFPAETCAGQSQGCDASGIEVDSVTLASVAFYVRSLAVPARRDIRNASVLEGEALFSSLGCAACHIPTLRTGVLDGVAAVSDQTIHPYTDLLIHDMGEGLSDGRPDFLASGREWRTAPLWGIGLTEVVSGHTRFLHDGRARNLEEAILWHGGEAEKAKEKYRNLDPIDRATLVMFLQSL
jgi:CxxC motif-containing protein (DUF1111 family)